MLHNKTTMLQLTAESRLTELDTGLSLSGAALQQALHEAQTLVSGFGATTPLVLWADNCIDWLLTDLACLQAQQVLIPAPLFASSQQLQHLLVSTGAGFLLTDQPIDLASAPWQELLLVGQWRSLSIYQTSPAVRHGGFRMPAGCQKITFTSGSTGEPKGVCLSAASQLTVAQSLVSRIGLTTPRHLCLLPLSLLLENIAGVYAPLLAGGEVLLCRDQARGFAGSQLVQPQRLLALISQSQPDSLIVVPELLQLLVQAAQQGWPVPASLQFIAVGGAKVAVDMLREAAALRLPVYQGYGLSECGSVVALSTVSATQGSEQQLQSVGRVLPHLQVRIVDGEIMVKTPFLGYLGQAGVSAADWVATGDLGNFNEQGELVISGRRKNLLINSFGRNISPEWVEAELTKCSKGNSVLATQAIVLGDSRPYCVALLYANAAVSDAALADFVSRVNKTLPDYARVQAYHRLAQPLTQADGFLTSNGRPKRAVIHQAFSRQINDLYHGPVGSVATAAMESTPLLTPAAVTAPVPEAMQE